MMEEQKTKLKFMRFRARGGSDYYDPQTDIRVVLPALVEMTLDVLAETSSDEKLHQEFIYLTKCFRILQIKLKEDDKDVAELMNEFYGAICKVSARALSRWTNTMTILLVTVYGFFDRRDSATDGPAIRSMLNTAKLTAMTACLPKELMEQVAAIYKYRNQILDEQYCPTEDGTVRCVQLDEDVILDIKKLVSTFIDHDGSDSWEDMAKACDDAYMHKKLTEKQKLAAALAYPTYESPYLEAEGEKDDIAP